MNEQLQPSVRKSRFFEWVLDDEDPPTGVFDEAVVRDGPGRPGIVSASSVSTCW